MDLATEDQHMAPSANEHSRDVKQFGSTNNHGTVLPDDFTRLSLDAATATALPPSSPVVSPLRQQVPVNGISSTTGPQQIQKSPLRSTPSSSSIGNSDRSRLVDPGWLFTL